MVGAQVIFHMLIPYGHSGIYMWWIPQEDLWKLKKEKKTKDKLKRPNSFQHDRQEVQR